MNDTAKWRTLEGEGEHAERARGSVDVDAQQCENPSWDELAAWRILKHQHSEDYETDISMPEPCYEMESPGVPGQGEAPM